MWINGAGGETRWCREARARIYRADEKDVPIARNRVLLQDPNDIDVALSVHRHTRVERKEQTGTIGKVFWRGEGGSAIDRAAEQNVGIVGSIILPDCIDVAAEV